MLQPEAIRQFLSAQEPIRIRRPDFRHAAVLMPIFWRDGEPHVVFTKRSQHVSTHKGQISFPGGSIDAEDLDAWSAALRETEEEIGVPRTEVELLGPLDDIITVTHFVVTPWVGRIPPDWDYRISRHELEYVFEAPLRDLGDPARLREQEVLFENRPYPIYYFQHGEHNIWGATAKILRQFLAATRIMPGSIFNDDHLPSDL